MKYRPLRGQKLEAVVSGQATPSETLAAYLDKGNAGHSLILNIESVPGMENLDEILQVEGVDGILVGPHDLSTSLEIPEQYDHPRFVAAVDEIIDKARAVGSVWGFTLDSMNRCRSRRRSVGCNGEPTSSYMGPTSLLFNKRCSRTLPRFATVRAELDRIARLL